MKHRKCEKCDRPATNHSVEIIKGKKLEKHLCDLHASEQGLMIKAAHPPIDELLTKFVKAQAGEPELADATCDHCGLAFSQFRDNSLLGCPGCYDSFEDALSHLLERAHEGGTHHLGKVPRRMGAGEQRYQHMLRMRKRLAEAITAEDYELAARLRDDIRRFEDQPS